MTRWLVWVWLGEALLKGLGAPPVNYFNQGNRWYAEGKFDRAEQAYRRAFAAPDLRYAAYFNAGNAAYRRRDYGQAVVYFEGALDAAPGDEDAWHNLELARRSAGLPDEAGAEAQPLRQGLALAGAAGSGGAGDPAADPALDGIRRREARLRGYYAPRRVEVGTGSFGRDIFTLPPDQLADYIREQTLAGYPFKPGSSLKPKTEKQSDEVDW